eukprot:970724-Amorphochlora_amoeboformis.AAC.1
MLQFPHLNLSLSVRLCVLFVSSLCPSLPQYTGGVKESGLASTTDEPSSVMRGSRNLNALLLGPGCLKLFVTVGWVTRGRSRGGEGDSRFGGFEIRRIRDLRFKIQDSRFEIRDSRFMIEYSAFKIEYSWSRFDIGVVSRSRLGGSDGLMNPTLGS